MYIFSKTIFCMHENDSKFVSCVGNIRKMWNLIFPLLELGFKIMVKISISWEIISYDRHMSVGYFEKSLRKFHSLYVISVNHEMNIIFRILFGKKHPRTIIIRIEKKSIFDVAYSNKKQFYDSIICVLFFNHTTCVSFNNTLNLH